MDFNSTYEFPRAHYTEQRIPQYRGHPLIEALPPILDEDAWTEHLFSMPDFSPEQRDWSSTERMHMIAQLANFMLPLPRHTLLAQSIDVLIRQGYVGREPRSAKAHRILTKLQEQQGKGGLFKVSRRIRRQLSSSLIGLSGMGKTTTMERIQSYFPAVIYHPDLDIYQVPVLHIEMPYDGASVKGLALSIFRKFDLLLPEANYSELYGSPHSGAETLMGHAARLLCLHHVGLLIIDEVQNLENSPKNRQSLMTLLVSASNDLGVPVLFVGTNKARRILSLDFRQARRSIGHGLAYFDRLGKGTPQKPCEWEDFVSALWRFQWLRKPVLESVVLTDLLYDFSQGIVDIAIKLFAGCQLRAMMDGSETITGQLIADVAHRELAMVEPMIDALRRNDIDALQLIDDIAPLNLEQLLQNIHQSYSGKKVRGVSIRPDNEQFAPTVTAALESLGFEPETAMNLAETVAAEGATNALDGVKKALSASTSGPKAKSTKSKKDPTQPVTYPAGDYRNALAATEGNTVIENLEKLGMLPDLDRIFAA